MEMERIKLLTNEPRILTNDPSMTAWGWAVLSGSGKVYETGCIKTSPEQKKRRIRKGDDTVRRASEIIRQLIEIIKQYDIQLILSELPHGSQNASAAVMIGLVTGIVQTLADCFDLPIEWYSEGDAKKCALNRLSATKGEIIERMITLYKSDWLSGTKYIDESIADALAIHHVASKTSSTLKMMRK